MVENKIKDKGTKTRKECIIWQWIKYCYQNKNILLWLDRAISHSVLRQICIALGMFMILLGGVSARYNYQNRSNPVGKALVDLISPVSMRSVVYETSSKIIVDTCQYSGPYCKSIPSDKTSPWGISAIYLLGAVFFSGLLIAIFTNALRTRADRFKLGKVRYHFFKNHIVILGYNDMVPGMIEKLLGEYKWPKRIIVGVKNNIPKIADRIQDQIEVPSESRKSILVLEADSNNTWELKYRMRVHKAKEVYILGAHDDAYSLNSYEKIQSLCKKNHPECYVQMQYQSTFALFQTYSKKDGLDHFHAFNFHDVLAREMIMRKEVDTRNDIVLTGPGSNKYVHLVIVGMTEMGEALAREAAFLCHYPNYVTNGLRTRITFVDPQAKENMTYFTGRYHHLFDLCNYSFRSAGETPSFPLLDKDFLDIEFEFIQANIAEAAMREEISSWAKDDNQILTIAVCADLPHRSMAAGLYLPDEVFYNKIPVWIYQPAKGDMAKFLQESPRFKDGVVTFGMSGKDLDVKNEKLINRAMKLKLLYDNIYGLQMKLDKKEITEETFLSEVDGMEIIYDDEDSLMEKWANELVFNKWSNIYSVASIEAKRRSVNDKWTEDTIRVIDEVEHNRWNVEKLLMGFRSTTDKEHADIINGETTKSKLKKDFYAHDNICPFDELDEVTKKYDHKFTLEINKIAPLDETISQEE